MQLESRQSGFFPNSLSHLDEFVLVLAGDIRDDDRGQGSQIREMMSNEMFDAVIVEANGIEHARCSLDRPRRLVADPRLARHGLGDDPAQKTEIHDACHLPGIAEGARRNKDGILKVKATKSDREIHGDCRLQIAD